MTLRRMDAQEFREPSSAVYAKGEGDKRLCEEMQIVARIWLSEHSGNQFQTSVQAPRPDHLRKGIRLTSRLQ